MTQQLSLVTLGLLCLPGMAGAQNQQGNFRPVTTTVKDAGTYHLASGTWSRRTTSVALLGPDVLYDNTCTSGYFFGLSEGDTILDSGRIPSTSSPASNHSYTGNYDLYSVTGFTIGYCTSTTGLADIDIGFTDCYAACDDVDLPIPLRTFNLVNLPGSPGGSAACWVLTIDLTGSGSEFNLGGDCNGAYDDNPSTDSFAWTWTDVTPGGTAGPLMAGDPQGLHGGGGPGCGPNSGVGALDQFQVGGGPTTPGCYWFGGYSAQNPFASFYMKLEGEEGTAGPVAAAYCFGDGTGASCPCGGVSAPGEGCPGSLGNGAVLGGNGEATLGNDTLQLTVTGVPGSKPGLLLRGNTRLNGGLGSPAGDGLMCLAGGSQRSQVQVTMGGATTFTDFGGSPFGSVANVGAFTHFQFWYRDPASACGGGFNFSNAVSVLYVP